MKLYEKGVYLVNGTEIIEEKETSTGYWQVILNV